MIQEGYGPDDEQRTVEFSGCLSDSRYGTIYAIDELDNFLGDRLHDGK